MATSMRNPVVVILGATGTGKTKLSLELAKRFNGEIISADSMQVYKGLDVITNKATLEERKAVPHHLIDYVSPLVEDSTVVEFRDKAVPIIDSLLDKNRLPIIVGGTNYYIESLLWKNLIDKQDVKKAAESNQNSIGKYPKLEGPQAIQTSDVFIQGPEKALDQTEGSQKELVTEEQRSRLMREKFERLTTPELYKQLMECDKTKALKLHPNDRRKLLRALEVYTQYGVPMTDVYRAQHDEVGEEVYSGPLRYPHTCMFWLQCEKEVHIERLDARVDQMIADGLVSELTEFHKSYNSHRLKEGQEADYTTGIFQSIGFKEFHKYLMLSEDERQTVQGQKVFEEGKENLKIATRRYARIQNRFVTNRILKRKGPPNYTLPIYGLDCSDVSSWTETVAKPAISIVDSILQGKKPEIDPINPDDHISIKGKFVYNHCPACDKVFTMEHDFLCHQKAKSHKHAMKKYKAKLAELSQILDKRTDQLQEELPGQRVDDPQAGQETDLKSAEVTPEEENVIKTK